MTPAQWHRRVEGQLQDAMNQHPNWFSDHAKRHWKSVRRSMAKRIVGEILAGGRTSADKRTEPACDTVGSRLEAVS